MFKFLLILSITFIIVIITLLLFITFINNDIKTHEKYTSISIETINGKNNEIILFEGYKYIIFRNSGNFILDRDVSNADILLVGGGGGGGYNCGWEGGGGGGGGGFGIGNINLRGGTVYEVNIGNGGAGATGGCTAGNNGGETNIIGREIDERAYGGGGGGWRPGNQGGSGGGGSGHAAPNNGYNGGNAIRGISLSNNNNANIKYYGNNGGIGYWNSGGAGGGGAGNIGGQIGANNWTNAAHGGIGKECIFKLPPNFPRYYAGGGGGGRGKEGGANGNGGEGGGGAGGIDGIANTGGGGGGNIVFNIGKNGGSGILIIRYVQENFENKKQIEKFYAYDARVFYKNILDLFIFKPPFGTYLAENWSGNLFKDIAGFNRDAITSGENIIKGAASGFGATGKINFISGGTHNKINWTKGNIPKTFTILSLTRYTGGSRHRILSNDRNGGNLLIGHWYDRRGICHFDSWKTNTESIGEKFNWLCCIVDNKNAVPYNILIDGVQKGTAHGGSDSGTNLLSVNDNQWGENSDWAISCVIIWDQILTVDEKFLLNTMIEIYKRIGGNLNSLIYHLVNNGEADNPNNAELALTEDDICKNRNTIFEYILEYSSSITTNINTPLEIKTTANEVLVPNKKITFSANRYNTDGVYIKNTNDANIRSNGDYIEITFTNSFILKKLSIKATEEIKNAPSNFSIYAILNGNELQLDEISLTKNDYLPSNCKANNINLNFLIGNNVSSNKYLIVFKKVFQNASNLDITHIEFFSGIRPSS
jgi:hypothetical protein